MVRRFMLDAGALQLLLRFGSELGADISKYVAVTVSLAEVYLWRVTRLSTGCQCTPTLRVDLEAGGQLNRQAVSALENRAVVY